jgi:hypothetical protein
MINPVISIAHRFADEPLLRDTWGAMCRDLELAPAETRHPLDEVARLFIRADEGDLEAERELLARYREDDRLRPGAHIRSVSPYGGLYEVDLASRAVVQPA